MGGGGAKHQALLVVLRHAAGPVCPARLTSQRVDRGSLLSCPPQNQQSGSMMKRLTMSVVFAPHEPPYWRHITFHAPIFERVGAHSCHTWMP